MLAGGENDFLNVLAVNIFEIPVLVRRGQRCSIFHPLCKQAGSLLNEQRFSSRGPAVGNACVFSPQRFVNQQPGGDLVVDQSQRFLKSGEAGKVGFHALLRQ